MGQISGTKKTVLIAGVIVFLTAVFILTSTGFYCKVPAKSATKGSDAAKGETVWFVTRGTDFGFVTSADGIAIAKGFSPNDSIRGNLDAEFERLVHKKVILRFGFSRALYLMTTDNVDLSPSEENAAGAESGGTQ